MISDKTIETLETGQDVEDPGVAKVEITENARVVLNKRYLRKDSSGEIVETPEGMLRRVARAIAKAEHQYGTGDDARQVEEDFYGIMASLEFVPNSPTLMNAGTGAGTLSACFVMGLDDNMEMGAGRTSSNSAGSSFEGGSS